MNEKAKLPKWLIKTFENGKECEDLCFMLIYCGAFYVLGVLFLFVCNPLGNEHLIFKIILSVIVLILLIVFGCWLNKKVSLLEDSRKKALDLYKNSKTKDDTEKAREEIDTLCVSIPSDLSY